MDRTLKQMRQAPPSLLQVEAAMPKRVLNTLVENFEVEDDIVVRTPHRLDYSDWMALHRLPLPHLKDPAFVPRVLWDLRRDVSASSTTSATRTVWCIIRSTRSPRSRDS